jgi:hypothetical protein
MISGDGRIVNAQRRALGMAWRHDSIASSNPLEMPSKSSSTMSGRERVIADGSIDGASPAISIEASAENTWHKAFPKSA